MKSPIGILRTLLPLFVILFTVAVAAQAQDEYSTVGTWESFDFAGKSITTTDINPLALEDLKLVRGIVFGKHGRVFKDFEINRYLTSRSWYKADPNFDNAKLNNTERKNLDVIRIAEATKHDTVQPGDMRLWENKALTRKKLGTHTNAEWTVIASEIEAIHGKRFDDTPWLQQYFDERYWYKAVDKYDAKGLNDVEKKNLGLVD